MVNKAKLQEIEQRRDVLARLIGSKMKNWVNVTSQREKKGHWNIKWILTKKAHENLYICYKDARNRKSTSIFVCTHRETTIWPALLSIHTEQIHHHTQVSWGGEYTLAHHSCKKTQSRILRSETSSHYMFSFRVEIVNPVPKSQSHCFKAIQKHNSLYY